MNKKSVEKDKEFFLILLAQGASASEEGVCLIGEYLLFLTKYSFLLTDKPQENIFLIRDFSSPGDISTQNPNGARYLDAKYSRWISTDPALGEYIPAAGKGTTEEAGKLPGMGGIYNSVNGNLYHYAGNNPVKYVDPDGRFPWAVIPIVVIPFLLKSDSTSSSSNSKLNELRVLAREIKATDMAGDKCINFKPKNASLDGCFARTSVIAEFLRGKGYKVNYAIVNHPTGIQEFKYHIAPCVEIDNENYVVDPMLNLEGPYSGLSKYTEWRDFQKPLDDFNLLPKTDIYSGYDNNGNPIENYFIMGFYQQDNKNSSLTVPEYAEKWLDNYVKTKETNYDGF